MLLITTFTQVALCLEPELIMAEPTDIQPPEPFEDSELQDPGGDDLSTEDIEGDALAYSQSELRQIVERGYGVSVLGGAPWQSFGVFAIEPWQDDVLAMLQLGYGNSTLRADLDDIRYEHSVTSTILSSHMMYFFTDLAPFFVGGDGGLTYWDSSLEPEANENTHDISGKATSLGAYVGLSFGMLWITQSEWLIGMRLVDLSASSPLLKMSSSGSSAAKDEIQTNMQSSRFRIGASFMLAIFI